MNKLFIKELHCTILPSIYLNKLHLPVLELVLCDINKYIEFKNQSILKKVR